MASSVVTISSSDSTSNCPPNQPRFILPSLRVPGQVSNSANASNSLVPNSATSLLVGLTKSDANLTAVRSCDVTTLSVAEESSAKPTGQASSGESTSLSLVPIVAEESSAKPTRQTGRESTSLSQAIPVIPPNSNSGITTSLTPKSVKPILKPIKPVIPLNSNSGVIPSPKSITKPILNPIRPVNTKISVEPSLPEVKAENQLDEYNNQTVRLKFDYDYIRENIKACCKIIDGHWLMKSKRMREGKKFDHYQKGCNQWLYFCDNKLDPRDNKIKMKATCREKECIYHWIRSDVVLNENETEESKKGIWPWDRIRDVIYADERLTFEESGHILWDHLHDKLYSKRRFFGVERPVNQWLYFCQKEILDPRIYSIRMQRLCNNESCINPDHWINTCEDEAIYEIKTKKIADTTIRDLATGCLLWTGPLTSTGYGATCFDGRYTTAHILAMKLHLKVKKLQEGTLVRHQCRNKHCCEITHLETGDIWDNNRDKSRDLTQSFARLTNVEVQEIIDNVDDMTSSELAELYGMSQRAIESILNGKSYKHITNPTDKSSRTKYYITDATPTEFFKQQTDRIRMKVKEVPHVDPTEPHWIWRGSINKRGYGCASLGNRSLGAHKASWIIYNRKEVPRGLVVRHMCGRTDCCNPKHLKIGTPKQNTADMIADGNMHSFCKISVDVATTIFKMIFNEKRKQIDVVRELREKHPQITREIVHRIAKKKTWGDLRAKLIMEGTIVDDTIVDNLEDKENPDCLDENPDQLDDFDETEYEDMKLEDSNNLDL